MPIHNLVAFNVWIKCKELHLNIHLAVKVLGVVMVCKGQECNVRQSYSDGRVIPTAGYSDSSVCMAGSVDSITHSSHYSSVLQFFV